MACSTAVPCVLLTRKGSQVQSLSRPPPNSAGQAGSQDPASCFGDLVPGCRAANGQQPRENRPEKAICLGDLCHPGGSLRTALTSRFVTPLLSSVVPQVRPSWDPSAAHPDSERPCRTTQRSRSPLELAFDTLARWGPGTTYTPAGRSRRRCSGARSCWVSTWPRSRRRPPTSSPTSAPTAPGSGA